VTSTLPVVDSLIALDPNRPIREADIDVMALIRRLSRPEENGRAVADWQT
jgi:hypothetical protein